MEALAAAREDRKFWRCGAGSAIIRAPATCCGPRARLPRAAAFPRDYDSLAPAARASGDYTAAAIASIAFGQPRAVLDGNVLRVVARVENDAADIAAPATRERFRAHGAKAGSTGGDPGAFNQALMELGATVCLPRHPLCAQCPLRSQCQARQQGTVEQLPVKLGTVRAERIEAVLLLVRRGQRILLRQRPSTERRMPGFWDLPAPEHLPGARPVSTSASFATPSPIITTPSRSRPPARPSAFPPAPSSAGWNHSGTPASR